MNPVTLWVPSLARDVHVGGGQAATRRWQRYMSGVGRGGSWWRCFDGNRWHLGRSCPCRQHIKRISWQDL
jgi:hypothetical protein